MPPSNRLELFEHDTLRAGQVRRGVDGAEIHVTDRHIDSLVRYNDRCERRFFSVGHRSVTTSSHVGYVEVGDLAIEILPKADRNGPRDSSAWRRGLLEMLRVAYGLRIAAPSTAAQSVGRSSLVELVAGRFVEEVERLLHEGLARGYRRIEENGPTFRGRLLVRQNLRENLVRADRFFVEHHVFDPDIAVNRILGAGLRALDDLALSPGLWSRARACRSAFPSVSDVGIVPELFQRIRIGRSTARYQDALTLARMLLSHRAPELRSGAAPVFAILFDMNALWERYVTWLFGRSCPPGATVSSQSSAPFFQRTGQAARRIRPDVVVRNARGRVLLVADAKWKTPAGDPSADDLKQMFVYNELLPADRAALIYPRCGGPGGVAGTFAVARGHACETVHLEVLTKEGWSSAAARQQVAALIGESTPLEVPTANRVAG